MKKTVSVFLAFALMVVIMSVPVVFARPNHVTVTVKSSDGSRLNGVTVRLYLVASTDVLVGSQTTEKGGKVVFSGTQPNTIYRATVPYGSIDVSVQFTTNAKGSATVLVQPA